MPLLYFHFKHLQMYTKIVAEAAIMLICLFAHSSLCHTRVVMNELGGEELFENNAEPTNNMMKTITGEETPVGKTAKYSCFPWIFNPGNYFTYFHILYQR